MWNSNYKTDNKKIKRFMYTNYFLNCFHCVLKIIANIILHIIMFEYVIINIIMSNEKIKCQYKVLIFCVYIPGIMCMMYRTIHIYL